MAGNVVVGTRLLAWLRGINVPVSATRAPRSTLFLRLLDSDTRQSAPLRVPEFPRLDASIGEYSTWVMLYDTVGDPNEDDRDGGGTDGYVRVRGWKEALAAPMLELYEKEEGGLVMFVLGLTRLPGFVTGEKGNGETEEEGECEGGVFPSKV
ncbi:hypothetical protein C0991_004845 [Blastosporella zonata]|nr:hypothetical protein C0991_004845 [Blastosporella zonata]